MYSFILYAEILSVCKNKKCMNLNCNLIDLYVHYSSKHLFKFANFLGGASHTGNLGVGLRWGNCRLLANSYSNVPNECVEWNNYIGGKIMGNYEKACLSLQTFLVVHHILEILVSAFGEKTVNWRQTVTLISQIFV